MTVSDTACDTTGDTTGDIVTECELEAPPETVWRALTEPALVAAWLMPNDLRAEPGHRFTLVGNEAANGEIRCEVLDAQAPRLLRYRWQERERGMVVDSVVTFELDATEAGGTWLRIVHGDFSRRVAPFAGAANQATMRMAA